MAMLRLCRMLGFLALLGLNLASCTRYEENEPVNPLDKESGPIPALRLTVRNNEPVQIPLDSLISHSEGIGVSFSSPLYGYLDPSEDRKFLTYKPFPDAGNWLVDSVEYQVCRKSGCRKGKLYFVNAEYDPTPPVADTLQLPDAGPFYLGYFSSLEVPVFPSTLAARIQTIRHRYYTCSVQGPDSTHILYFAGGGSTQGTFGFDEVSFLGKTPEGQWVKGRVSFILGDTCEAQARDDAFLVLAESITWLPSQWLTNDGPCFGSLEGHSLRLHPENAAVRKVATNNGIVTDTLINGERRFRYQKTNPAAASDAFWYYLEAGPNQRLTRARIRLTF
jgi:hypothetical protein